MEQAELAKVLEALGCPPGKSGLMAGQLDRKARMDAARLGIAHDDALKKLLGLMAQGWAAEGKHAKDNDDVLEPIEPGKP